MVSVQSQGTILYSLSSSLGFCVARDSLDYVTGMPAKRAVLHCVFTSSATAWTLQECFNCENFISLSLTESYIVFASSQYSAVGTMTKAFEACLEFYL